MTRLTDKALRLLLTGLHRLMKVAWRSRRPRSCGAHALALTPEQRIVLVKLRYARGWRLPGGRRDPDEAPGQAVLRELREEIGLTAHGPVHSAWERDEINGRIRDLSSLLIVEDVRYRPPQWSWEVEDIMEATVDELPADLAPIARDWIDALRPELEKMPRR